MRKEMRGSRSRFTTAPVSAGIDNEIGEWSRELGLEGFELGGTQFGVRYQVLER